jgi:hypothetical protein
LAVRESLWEQPATNAAPSTAEDKQSKRFMKSAFHHFGGKNQKGSLERQLRRKQIGGRASPPVSRRQSKLGRHAKRREL